MSECINCRYKDLDAPCKDCMGEKYEQLQAENERLKREKWELIDENNNFTNEIVELRDAVAEREEALRKCYVGSQYKCFSCECDRWMLPEKDEHTDDCEYIRLTGGRE